MIRINIAHRLSIRPDEMHASKNRTIYVNGFVAALFPSIVGFC